MSKHSFIDARILPLVTIAVALTVSILTGCGSDPEVDRTSAERTFQTTRVELVTMPDLYEAVGSIRSTTRSTVASKLMGTVTAIAVTEGDRVRRGQPLVEIDPREIDAHIRKAEAGLDEVEQEIAGAKASLSGAEANFDLARATFERYEALRARRSVSPQEFDEIGARYKAARAEWVRSGHALEGLHARRLQALADLSSVRTRETWARITSPVDGIITARYVDVGDQASPGTPLVAIDDPQSYRLDVQVDERRLSAIRIGNEVTVRVESAGYETTGIVKAVAPSVDPTTRSALVKIDLDDTTNLQSGMFARAYFPVGERQALMVPTSAITHRGQLEGIYIVDESGGASFRLIRTGTTIGTGTEVLSGARAGDRVVTGGSDEPVSEPDIESQSPEAASHPIS